jgi:hypothetical protein
MYFDFLTGAMSMNSLTVPFVAPSPVVALRLCVGMGNLRQVF